jgi:hypothetical protein
MTTSVALRTTDGPDAGMVAVILAIFSIGPGMLATVYTKITGSPGPTEDDRQ